MKYRKFSKSDWEISEVSIGVLRWEDAVAIPDKARNRSHIEAIRYAIDQGLNYINLGFPSFFEHPRKACAYIKEALGGGYRDKVKIAVNILSGEISSRQALDDALNEQLSLFDLEKVDFCVIGGVDRATWPALKSMDIAFWMSGITASGKADHFALGFHDDAHYLKDMIDTYPQWAFLQMELSLLDYRHHPGAAGLKFAKEAGIPVIATDITKAGRLLSNIPEDAEEILEKASQKRNMEERCLRWALAFEEVSSVQLSVQAECGTVEQVKKYLAYAEGLSSGDLDIGEMTDAAKIRGAYSHKRDYPCTACRCCMPCPLGIDVPRLLELLNDEKMFSDSLIPKLQYTREKHQEIRCRQCGCCSRQCPRKLKIQNAANEAYEKYANK